MDSISSRGRWQCIALVMVCTTLSLAPNTAAHAAGSGGTAAANHPTTAPTASARVATTATVRSVPLADGHQQLLASERTRRKRDPKTKQWQELDGTLTRRNDGRLAPRVPLADVSFSTNAATSSLASVTTNAGTFALAHPGAHATGGTAQATRVSYDHALRNGDTIVEEPRLDGFSETVVVPNHRAGDGYDVTIAMPPGVAARQANGGIEFVLNGTVVALFGGGSASDATNRKDIDVDVTLTGQRNGRAHRRTFRCHKRGSTTALGCSRSRSTPTGRSSPTPPKRAAATPSSHRPRRARRTGPHKDSPRERTVRPRYLGEEQHILDVGRVGRMRFELWRAHPDGTALTKIPLRADRGCRFDDIHQPYRLPTGGLGAVRECFPVGADPLAETNTLVTVDLDNGTVQTDAALAPVNRVHWGNFPEPDDVAIEVAWDADMQQAIAAVIGNCGTLVRVTSHGTEPLQLAVGPASHRWNVAAQEVADPERGDCDVRFGTAGSPSNDPKQHRTVFFAAPRERPGPGSGPRPASCRCGTATPMRSPTSCATSRA